MPGMVALSLLKSSQMASRASSDGTISKSVPIQAIRGRRRRVARSAPAGVCWKPGNLLNSPDMGVDRGGQGPAEGGVGLDATSLGHVFPGQTAGSLIEFEAGQKARVY